MKWICRDFLTCSSRKHCLHKDPHNLDFKGDLSIHIVEAEIGYYERVIPTLCATCDKCIPFDTED